MFIIPLQPVALMNKFVIILLLGLSGCSTAVPVTVKFPEAPDVLLIPAPALKPLAADKHQLSDLLENINENYGTYYEIREKLQAWQYWYKTQKNIYDKI
jgi:hypothetical protein